MPPTIHLVRHAQTTLLSFESEISRGIQNIALPELQETSDLPCDTGSNLTALKEEFKDKHVQLSLVPEDWDSKMGKWAPQQEAIEARCREARQWLKNRDEKEIVVVTHGGLLHYLTEDWTGSVKFQGNARPQEDVMNQKYSRSLGTGWENTEFRSYTFVSGDDENASMEETEDSRHRPGDSRKPLTKEEKTQLRETATKNWEALGYEKASKV
ncbi:MAG: hypothetical protein Q9186_002093 [Xanthomendoza sp. 1 TL-2023]